MKSTDTYIVTGATGGIGGALVEALMHRRVPHIILACRDIGRARQLIDRLSASTDSSTTLTAMHLDLTSMASVDRFAEQFLSMKLPLKALLNNAGTMPGGVHVTADGYEEATQTNFLAPVRLTRRLLPAMSAGSSIVFTTSMTRHMVRLRNDWRQHAIACRHPLRRFTVYGRSKLMLTLYARLLSDELAPRGIQVNCSDPGIADTAIIKMNNRIIERLSELFFRPLINTPGQGAEPALRALDSSAQATIFTKNKQIIIKKDIMPIHLPEFD